jgi:hypothetical protein
VAAQKAAGNDIEKFLEYTGTEFSLQTIKSEAALSKIGLFFAKMGQTLDMSTARLDGIEAGIDYFVDQSKRAFAPDQLFDIIKAGYNPSDIGFGSVSGSLDPLIGQAKQFDPKFGEGLDYEMQGAKVTRTLQSALVANDSLKLDTKNKTGGQALDDFLSDSFEQTNKDAGGSPELTTKFNEFLDANNTDVAGAIDTGGNVDISKANDIVAKFAEGLDQGFVDNLKRINEVNKKFGAEYGNLLAERYAKEQELTSLDQQAVQLGVKRLEFENKLNGLSGAALRSKESADADFETNATLDATLLGTGLDSRSSIKDIGAGLQDAQKRKDEAGSIAAAEIAAFNDPDAGNVAGTLTPVKPKTALDATKLQTEIEQKAADDVNRYTEALKYQADGTATAAKAMDAFNAAAERAANSSKFLTDNLLGTDDQMQQTIRGMQVAARLKSLAPNQRLGAIANLSEKDRAGLNAYRGSRSGEDQVQFDKDIGLPTTNLKALPEAKAAQDAQAAQLAAVEELSLATAAGMGTLNTNIADLKSFYEQQFSGTSTLLNAFNEAVTKASTAISALPSVINHTMKVDGTINITGADFLAKSTAALKSLVDAEVAKVVEARIGAVLNVNPDLNKPTSAVKSVGTSVGSALLNTAVPGAGMLIGN